MKITLIIVLVNGWLNQTAVILSVPKIRCLKTVRTECHWIKSRMYGDTFRVSSHFRASFHHLMKNSSTLCITNYINEQNNIFSCKSVKTATIDTKGTKNSLFQYISYYKQVKSWLIMLYGASTAEAISTRYTIEYFTLWWQWWWSKWQWWQNTVWEEILF